MEERKEELRVVINFKTKDIFFIKYIEETEEEMLISIEKKYNKNIRFVVTDTENDADCKTLTFLLNHKEPKIIKPKLLPEKIDDRPVMNFVQKMKEQNAKSAPTLSFFTKFIEQEQKKNENKIISLFEEKNVAVNKIVNYRDFNKRKPYFYPYNVLDLQPNDIINIKIFDIVKQKIHYDLGAKCLNEENGFNLSEKEQHFFSNPIRIPKLKIILLKSKYARKEEYSKKNLYIKTKKTTDPKYVYKKYDYNYDQRQIQEQLKKERKQLIEQMREK